MQPWHCVNTALHRLATLALLALIALLGCSNSSDNATAQDVANRIFIFDSSFIDTDLEGLTTCLEFGPVSATDEDRVPFTLLQLQGVVTLPMGETCTDEPIATESIATFSGPATIHSIELRIETITDENGATVDSIVIFDVDFAVGETIKFDADVDKKDDGSQVFTLTNDDGDEIHFEFPKDGRVAFSTTVN